MKRRVRLIDQAERFTQTNLFVLLVNIIGAAVLYGLGGRALNQPADAWLLRAAFGAMAGAAGGISFGLSMRSLIEAPGRWIVRASALWTAAMALTFILSVHVVHMAGFAVHVASIVTLIGALGLTAAMLPRGQRMPVILAWLTAGTIAYVVPMFVFFAGGSDALSGAIMGFIHGGMLTAMLERPDPVAPAEVPPGRLAIGDDGEIVAVDDDQPAERWRSRI
jgi:hypothetical protein